MVNFYQELIRALPDQNESEDSTQYNLSTLYEIKENIKGELEKLKEAYNDYEESLNKQIQNFGDINEHDEKEYKNIKEKTKNALDEFSKYIIDKKINLEDNDEINTKLNNQIPNFSIKFPILNFLSSSGFNQKKIEGGVCLGITATLIQFFFANDTKKFLSLLIAAYKKNNQNQLTKNIYSSNNTDQEIIKLLEQFYIYMGYDLKDEKISKPQNIHVINKQIQSESEKDNKTKEFIPDTADSSVAIFENKYECENIIQNLISELDKKFNQYALNITMKNHSTSICVSKNKQGDHFYYGANHDYHIVTDHPFDAIETTISYAFNEKDQDNNKMIDNSLPVGIEVLISDTDNEKFDKSIDFKQFENTYTIKKEHANKLKAALFFMMDINCENSLKNLLEAIINSKDLTTDEIIDIIKAQIKDDKFSLTRTSLESGIYGLNSNAVYTLTSQILHALNDKKITESDVKELLTLDKIYLYLKDSDKKTVSAFFRAFFENMESSKYDIEINNLLEKGTFLGAEFLSTMMSNEEKDFISACCIDALINSKNIDFNKKKLLLKDNQLLKNIDQKDTNIVTHLIETLCGSDQITNIQKESLFNQFFSTENSYKLISKLIINSEITNTESINMLFEKHILQNNDKDIINEESVSKIVDSELINENNKIKLLLKFFDLNDDYNIKSDINNEILQNILNKNISFLNGKKILLQKIGFYETKKDKELINTIIKSDSSLAVKMNLILGKSFDEEQVIISNRLDKLIKNHSDVINLIKEISLTNLLDDDQKIDLLVNRFKIISILLKSYDIKNNKIENQKIVLEIYSTLTTINNFYETVIGMHSATNKMKNFITFLNDEFKNNNENTNNENIQIIKNTLEEKNMDVSKINKIVNDN